jgi:RNA polymerase sigma-70 factor (ECF subfamily)
LLLRAVAEDVTSEVFLKVAGQIAEFPGATAEDFRRWLFRIATNEINAYLRQTIRRRELLEAAVELGQVDVSACIVLLDDDSPVDWEEVYRAIGQLSETEQSIISLRFFGSLTHDQIAEVLSRSPTSVRMTLSRSLAKLRKRLQGVERTPMGSQPSEDRESENE